MQFPEALERRLDFLAGRGCLRSFSFRQGVDFSSNDYLGFSEDLKLRSLFFERLKEVPMGSSASRLLRGQLKLYDEVEMKLAQFCNRESALLFPSGYQANIGLLSAILGPEDLVFSDQLNHASIIDGIRLSRAKKIVYPHTDTKALRDLLQKAGKTSALKVIVSESVFSMDGDCAPLRQLADLAQEFSALLIVDEAHATGIWGKFDQNLGGGWVQSFSLEERVFATIHPAGKAFGVAGAWVCGDARLKEYLINCSRPQIFSTALFPALAISLHAVLDYWEEVGVARASKVLLRSKSIREQIESWSSLKGSLGESLIIPIVIGENSAALQVASFLQSEGLDVRAIRPPTVPAGGARLRLTVNWSQTFEDTQRLIQALKFCLNHSCFNHEKNP